MEQLVICLLGTFRVMRGSTLIDDFPTNKVRALLAYLAIESDRPHPRESLAALLWPESPESDALASLRNALAGLRRTLRDGEANPPYLLINHFTVQFNRHSNCRVDAVDLAATAPAAWGAGAGGMLYQDEVMPADTRPENRPPGLGSLDWPASAEPGGRLSAALDLYRGPFLAGLSLPDCGEFEEWASLWRERLHRAALEGLGRLTEYYEAQGNIGAAVAYARRQVTLDPFDENGYRRLMRLLFHSGRRNEALAQFTACQRILRDQLGIEPDEQTCRLAEEISKSTPGIPQVGRHNLPALLVGCIGRQTELDRLEGLLADPACRLVSIVGSGGVGKSHLALWAAWKALPAFSGRVFLVEMNAAWDTDSFFPSIARVLKMGMVLGTDAFGASPSATLKEQVIDFLREKPGLLILDSFETHLEIAGQVSDLLRYAPELKLLVTSRVVLNLEGETVLRLEGLVCPGEIDDPGEETSLAALELFESAARCVHPSFRISRENQPAVTEICRLVQGYPLGILLAAGWVGVLAPHSIAAEMRRSLDFLSDGWRNLPGRQRSLRATFEYSWKLLDPEQQTAFQCLAVFPGSFHLTPAVQVCGLTPHQIKGLVDQSLLQTLGDDRFRLHGLLRQFAEDKLAQSVEGRGGLEERFSRYYLGYVAESLQRLRSPDQPNVLVEMNAEYANLRKAWGLAVQDSQLDLLKKALDGLAYYYLLTCQYEEGYHVLADTAEKLSAGSILPEEGENWDRLRIWQAYLLRFAGKIESALKILLPVVDRFDGRAACTPADRGDYGFACLVIASACIEDDPVKGLDWIAKGLRVYRSIADPWFATLALVLSAAINDQLGNRREAYAAIKEALENQPEPVDPFLSIRTKWQESITLMLFGDYERAMKLVGDCVGYYQAIDSSRARLEWSSLWVTWLVHAGRNDEAAGLISEVLAATKAHHLPTWSAFFSMLSLSLDLTAGKYAEVLKNSPVDMRENENNRHFDLLFMGEIYLVQGCLERAKRYVERSLVIWRTKPRSDHLGLPYSILALLAYLQHDYPRARTHLVEALRCAVTYPAYVVINYSLACIAVILAENDQLEKAVEVYAAVEAHPTTHCKLVYDLFKSRIDPQVAGLPEQVLQRARQRGARLDRYELAGLYLRRLSACPGLIEGLAKP